MKFALVFPGQGAQKVGMGRDLYAASKTAKKVFQEADDALGFSLSDIIFNGPEDKLVLTEYTQPAILTDCIAIYRTLTEEHGVKLEPAFVAGHSLGEYTALVASGVLSLEDGVKLVHLRGHLMQEAVPTGQGAMAAILGLGDEDVAAICKEAAEGEICEPANFNMPGQLVISGHTKAVARAIEIAKSRGAKRSLLLNVSAPFHCSLMRPVADHLAAAMEKCTWHQGMCPLVANVSAQAVSDVATVRRGLYEQTYSPVQWTKSVQYMVDNGVGGFIEMGPGKVLIGMIKHICKGLHNLNVENCEDLGNVAEYLASGGLQ